jgi:hypothetical protein
MRVVKRAAMASALMLMGCEGSPQEPKPEPALVPSAQPAAPAMPAAQKSAPEAVTVTWKDPGGWKRVPPPNRMRKASYEIAPVAGDKEPAQVGVFYFGAGQGGSIDKNMERWSGEFSGVADADIKRSQRKAGGLLQHVIEIEDGTFSSGMGRSPSRGKEHWAVLGAIVETPSGLHFFKMTGPKATVKQARTAFFELLDSIEVKK